MKQQDLINTCVFEQIQGLLFSDLSGPLRSSMYASVADITHDFTSLDSEHQFIRLLSYFNVTMSIVE